MNNKTQQDQKRDDIFISPQPGRSDEVLVLDPKDPNTTAHKFIDHKYRNRKGQLCLCSKGNEFWQFNGSCYEEHELNMLSAEVYAFMSAAQCRFQNRLIPMIVKPSDVENVLKCIKAGITIPAKLPQPCWIKSEKYAPELFAFRNQLVNIHTGETLDPTPELWITDTVDFDYDPSTQCPRWVQLLEEAHPSDREAQDCLEELMGYGMSYDMQFEKIGVFGGKTRAGKSTIIHILNMLVGKRAFAPMNFNHWMGEKSRENIIGKKVLAFSDVRLKPPKVYGNTVDPGGLDHASIQTLLKISGRDSDSVGRLYKKAWEGELVCKIFITFNEEAPLNIQDQVLLGRLVTINFQRSWLNDPNKDDYLRNKLDAELPGIANRCLAAYRRLLARGYFIQPKSAAGLVRQMEAQVHPIAAFMQENYVIDDGARGPYPKEIFDHFKEWCKDNHKRNLLDTYKRPQELMKGVRALREFSMLRLVREHGETVGRYPGIRHRTKKDDIIEEQAEIEEQVDEARVVVVGRWRRF